MAGILAVGLAIGLLAGLLSGVAGIGGGVVIVPALVFLGLSQREASGTSLAALLMPVGILGVIEYGRRHEVRTPYAVGIALGLTLGAAVGARLAGQLPNVVLQRLFGVLLIGLAVRFFVFAS